MPLVIRAISIPTVSVISFSFKPEETHSRSRVFNIRRCEQINYRYKKRAACRKEDAGLRNYLPIYKVTKSSECVYYNYNCRDLTHFEAEKRPSHS